MVEQEAGKYFLKQRGLPTPAELDVVREWARFAGLTISPYVRAG